LKKALMLSTRWLGAYTVRHAEMQFAIPVIPSIASAATPMRASLGMTAFF
jgi:hypothetical protein